MKIKWIITLFSIAMLMTSTAIAGKPGGDKTPAANKTAVVGSKAYVKEWNGWCGASFPSLCGDSNTLPLLQDVVKVPDKGDLAIYVSMECFVGHFDLDVDYYPFGIGIDGRRAWVEVWVKFYEADGITELKHANGDPIKEHKIRFCGEDVFQLYGNGWYNGFDLDLDISLGQFGGAHAFNWAVLNLPSGEVVVRLYGRLFARAINWDYIPDEFTWVVVGKRSMIIEPIHTTVDETLGDDS